ncbi:fimbria/pilus outer membrane usher protein [Aeromonas simiae]|uniref:fimbria/pilus outer membrane usher protein n=1 Tax=Aeromonas simiae TaxID=218936 RepID=UPI0006942146|nr:fimbria/pilus outer membrane usher protein [Aeromonas simiae]
MKMKNRVVMVRMLLLRAIAATLPISAAHADTFNSNLLVGASSDMDWSGDAMMIAPGAYEFDVYVNQQWRGKFTLRIVKSDDESIFVSLNDIPALGILGLEALTGEGDVELKQILHGGKSDLVFGEMKVMLEIPQAYVEESSRNWVNPDKWDRGINGLYSSYNVSYYDLHTKESGASGNRSAFLNLHSGLNLGGWHLRDASNFSYDDRSGHRRWHNTSRYLERALPSITGVASAGDRYSTSRYFDSLRFRGLTLDKDVRMLPDKDHAYMPLVRGEASTSAVINVYQDGRSIYQISVPPGPFAIRDLMPTGSRSDLNVEVKNSGGKTEYFVVPFATMADMMRPGTDDYHLNIGQAKIDGNDENPLFLQASYARGVNNYWTLFGGVTGSGDYHSYLMGSAFSLPHVGSVSANVEQSFYDLGGHKRSGEKYAVSYSKYFATNTNLTLANYYYRTRNFLSFSDYLSAKDAKLDPMQRNKQVFSVSLAQNLPDPYGRFTFDAYVSDYWSDVRATKQYSLSYNNTVGKASYTLSLRRSDYDQNFYESVADDEGYFSQQLRSRSKSENSAYLSVTVPLTLFDRPASLTARTSFDDHGYESSSVGMSGVLEQVDYSLSASHDHEGNNKAVDLYGSWSANKVNLSAGLTEASDYRQASLGASGTVLAYADDVMLSADTGNTFVILDAPGVENAMINGDARRRTDKRGRALISGASAYRMNDFMLESDERMDSDVDVLSNIARVAPYEGSIIHIKYQTDTRKSYVLDIEDHAGSALPFGATVYGEQGEEIGHVAQGSQLFIKADSMPAHLKVRYRKGKRAEECTINDINPSGINICA